MDEPIASTSDAGNLATKPVTKPVSKKPTQPDKAKGKLTGENTAQWKEQDIQSLIGSNDAKAKTQVTTTTSMAVIHIGILKAILDLGPEGISYYEWCLGIIITALILQFISGIIAIYIATIRSIMSQHTYDFSYYFKAVCCPCLINKTAIIDLEDGLDAVTGEETSMIESDTSNTPGCCCGSGSVEDHDDTSQENILVNTYLKWSKLNFTMQLKTANCTDDIATIHERIDFLQEERNTALAEVSDPKDPRIIDIDQRIAKQQERLLDLTKLQHDAQVMEQKGELLKSRLQTVMATKVTAKTSLLQCVLTVLAYIVLALNAVITGFGLANVAAAQPP